MTLWRRSARSAWAAAVSRSASGETASMGNLVAPAAEHGGKRRRRAVKMELRQVLEGMAMQAAVEHPGG